MMEYAKCRWHENDEAYQSMLCGGSSLERPVLTVSVQPVDRNPESQHLTAETFPGECPPSHTGFRYLNSLIMWMGSCRIRDLSRYACPSCMSISFFFSFSSLGIECSRTWDWQLALTLQEGSVGVDELVGLDIADGDTRHVGGVRRGDGLSLGGRMEADGVGRRVVVAGR